jgi:DNA-binding response OmpR family regulator
VLKATKNRRKSAAKSQVMRVICMISAIPMLDTRPYALIVERDEESRARITAALRESGFVVAAFRESRGALSALAAHPVDIAILASQVPGGEDALAAARQMRHCRPGSKILFAGAMIALPAGPDEDASHAVTRPFDKRRFLSAVFELLSRDGDIAVHRDEAEQGLMAARLACLRNQRASGEGARRIEGGSAALPALPPTPRGSPGAA